jgi:hypothetical protein
MALHLTLSGIMALYLTLFSGTNRLMVLNPSGGICLPKPLFDPALYQKFET